MIKVACNTDNGSLKELTVSGHASEDGDNAVICSAVSCLTRTVVEITEKLNGVTFECSAPESGHLKLLVKSVNKEVYERYCGITDYLIFGLVGIVRDYPKSLTLKINYKEWYNGSQKRWW